eukprot:UC1_evm1s377
MAKSIRSKIKRKFRAIKRAKLDAKKAAEKESAKAEAVFARMEGVEAGDGTERAGSEAELEQEEDVLANNSTLTKTQLAKARKAKKDAKNRFKKNVQKAQTAKRGKRKVRGVIW